MPFSCRQKAEDDEKGRGLNIRLTGDAKRGEGERPKEREREEKAPGLEGPFDIFCRELVTMKWLTPQFFM